MEKFTVGIDFGTLSARAILVNVKGSAKEVAQSDFIYPHAVMDKYLPCKSPLPRNFALQHPKDYLDALATLVRDVITKAGISPEQIIGIGIDFTASTVLPVLKDGTPLCFLEEYKSEPHAYVKLWKHHAAQQQADYLNESASKSGEGWLSRYGGKISCEWEIPKLMEILDANPQLFDKTAYFIEAMDWIIWRLIGKPCRSNAVAGYKGLWSKSDGYPSAEFFRKLNPKLENIIGTKISDDICYVGEAAGRVTESGAQLSGLPVGCVVATGQLDAHAALPAAGITKSGEMMLIIGTSGCHIVLSENKKEIKGICGYVDGGVVPGLFAYEAGQCCVGDQFDWFVKNCVPASYSQDAADQNQNIHKYLRCKAQALAPGESGLIALDWWNGNRSVLADSELSGLIIGMTISTKPEEIYRALIESTAFGTRMIIEAFEQGGVSINRLCAGGGIAKKDEMLMQIYADITNRQISLSGSAQAPALGSAIYAAAAAGYYPSVSAAAKVMAAPDDTVYTPNSANVKIYDSLYKEYKQLHDLFGKGENNVMKRLKRLKSNTGKN